MLKINHYLGGEKLFEAIDEEEFKSKLKSTMEDLEGIFDLSNSDSSSEGNDISENMFQMPDSEQVHEHISNLLQGKLGKLASEIAEETAEELELDISNVSSSSEMFEKLFKNPTKLMQIVKKVETN